MTSKEAYNFVLHELEQNTNFTKDSTFGKAVDMLNDLVERDTPLNVLQALKKGIGSSVLPYYICPNKKCNRVLPFNAKVLPIRCDLCGQRLKWSDNND